MPAHRIIVTRHFYEPIYDYPHYRVSDLVTICVFDAIEVIYGNEHDRECPSMSFCLSETMPEPVIKYHSIRKGC